MWWSNSSMPMWIDHWPTTIPVPLVWFALEAKWPNVASWLLRTSPSGTPSRTLLGLQLGFHLKAARFRGPELPVGKWGVIENEGITPNSIKLMGQLWLYNQLIWRVLYPIFRQTHVAWRWCWFCVTLIPVWIPNMFKHTCLALSNLVPVTWWSGCFSKLRTSKPQKHANHYLQLVLLAFAGPICMKHYYV